MEEENLVRVCIIVCSFYFVVWRESSLEALVLKIEAWKGEDLGFNSVLLSNFVSHVSSLILRLFYLRCYRAKILEIL